MVERLKRWESPRRRGRNDKGKGGAARKRQLKKRQQMLRKKLKASSQNQKKRKNKGRELNSLPSFFIPVLINPNVSLSRNTTQNHA